jgi:hypothetical protein
MGEQSHHIYLSALIRRQQHVHMHQHVAHPPGPEPSPGIIDNISDTLLNAFARVRKPDERFLAMRESVDKFEDGLVVSERLWNRVRSRTSGESLPMRLCVFNVIVVEYLRLKEMETRNLVKILRRITTTWQSLSRV